MIIMNQNHVQIIFPLRCNYTFIVFNLHNSRIDFQIIRIIDVLIEKKKTLETL